MKNPKQLQKSTTNYYYGQRATTNNAGYINHLKKTLNGTRNKIKTVGRKIFFFFFCKFYPTKTPVITVIIIKNGKTEIPAMISQNTENKITRFFLKQIKKYIKIECVLKSFKKFRPKRRNGIQTWIFKNNKFQNTNNPKKNPWFWANN